MLYLCIKTHCYGTRRKENRKRVRIYRTLHNHYARSGHFARLRCGQAVRNIRKGNATIRNYPSEMSKEFQSLIYYENKRNYGNQRMLRNL